VLSLVSLRDEPPVIEPTPLQTCPDAAVSPPALLPFSTKEPDQPTAWQFNDPGTADDAGCRSGGACPALDLLDRAIARSPCDLALFVRRSSVGIASANFEVGAFSKRNRKPSGSVVSSRSPGRLPAIETRHAKPSICYATAFPI